MVSLAIDPPPSRGDGSGRRGIARAATVVSLLAALGAGFWLGRLTARTGPFAIVRAPEPAAVAAGSAAAAGAAAQPAPAAQAVPAPPASPIAAAPAPQAAQAVAGAPAGAVQGAGPASAEAPPAASPPVHRLSVALRGPLEDSITAALPADQRQHAEELTAVVNRLLVWELQVAREGRRGDRLDVVWTPPVPAAAGLPVSGEPTVLALRYASSKLGAVLSAYRFEASGSRWARYYRADGSEVEARLVDGPIADYEQVTSLLRDGRRHKGVDFKTPVGSPVLAPFDGVIARRNWNFAGNGNCLDVRDPATGRHALFLHLDVLPADMRPGRRVKKGEVIAASGNTGRSFAPHLHYQLEDSAGRVLDPFAVHRVERRALTGESKVAFELARAKLDAALGTVTAAAALTPVGGGAAPRGR